MVQSNTAKPARQVRWQDEAQADSEALKRKTLVYGTFKKNRYGVDDTTGDPIKEFYLEGTWEAGTLKGYNSAIVKYVRFGSVHSMGREEVLPATKKTILQFIVWASHKVDPPPGPKETISRATIRKYIQYMG